jgi:putative hemin transport protein
MSNNTLKEQYLKLKEEQPKLRIRNAAEALGVSEAQLVALNIGAGTTLLNSNFQDLLLEVHQLGEVMALTRNNSAVHERKGVYNNVSFNSHVGLVVNEDVDLRLFMMHWAVAFAVIEGERSSIQFFDKSGEAVHKIYATPNTNMEAFQSLVAKFTANDQNEQFNYVAYPEAEAEFPDSAIDVNVFREGWLGLQDTHDFFGLTRKHKLTRTQALRLAPENHVYQLSNSASRNLLDLASERTVPIMVFVGNKGCIQIHSGEVKKVMEAGPWYNVLDPKFNLHLNEKEIVSTYVVKKPSVDGMITAVEVFDKNGEIIVQFFGKRKPGIPELEEWRTLVNDLPKAE